MKRSLFSCFILGLVLTLATGCASQTLVATSTNPVDAATLIPTDTVSVPILTADTGAIKVTILDVTTGRPVEANLSFYLADLLPMKERQDAYVPALDTKTAPNGASDNSGSVIIINKPGYYGLTMMTPLGPILLHDAANNKDMLVTIKAGEVTDLGSVKCDLPIDLVQKP